jgi:predicted branched-subunit amino acid permease
MSDPSPDRPPASPPRVFLEGLRSGVGSVFFYVLVGNYLGLGALAYEFGFSFWWMAASTVLVWAAPAQVILISTLTTSALVEVALAVTLSSVRFLPMVAALIPLFNAPGVRQRDLLLPMHLTAISVWVEGMRLLPTWPRRFCSSRRWRS